MKTRGWYLGPRIVLEFAPAFLYSVDRDIASSGGGKAPYKKTNKVNAHLDGELDWRRLSCVLWVFALVCFCFGPAVQAQRTAATPQLSKPELSRPELPRPELSRTVRSWEFLPIVGTRAGLFGHEPGRFEAWVYPLKILRDFHLTFHVGDRALPAESLARTLTVRPESATILYAGDSFRVRETLCVPVNEPGAVILLDIETEQPLEVEATFVADFQLEWPAALGGTYVEWDAQQHAFVFGEEAKKFAAFVGSPGGEDASLAYETNYSSTNENSFRLGVTQKGKDTKAVILAASVNGRADAEKTYQHLFASYENSMRESAEYYSDYLSKTVSLELPDAALQQAYDWARVSTIQGVVNNPYLGTGLVAGYRTSGVGQRPGFAWFFGRDSLWTSFALNAEGDYATARTALDFISKYQREDGKVPHEISQSASLVPWFKDYPYAYVSADATPLFIIAMNDYVTQSGDVAFAREKWDNVWSAYQFLRSTYDAQGFAQNFGIGHGWVEGGPLLPVKNEYYQAGLAVEAQRALSDLARTLGKADIARELTADFERQKSALDQAFWSPDKKNYAFALNRENQRVDELSVLTTVPMWFGLADAGHADDTIAQLAAVDHETDWGMRIISSQAKVYDGSGYHFGAVWPLFTGWASVGEYRYHHALPAYFNLRANALLGLDGALGHFTEVLSGDYYQSFATSSPHQIWSAAMVISPILRGMFGLQVNAEKNEISFVPHVPADWTWFAIRNVRVGDASLDFQYGKTTDSLVLHTKRTGKGECWVEFSPAFSLRTKFVSLEMDGKPIPFKVQPNANDQHLYIRFQLREGESKVVIRMKDDFGLAMDNELPPLGSASRSLRVTRETWNSARTQLDVDVSGVAGAAYALNVWNPGQIISVEGATLAKTGKLRIQMSPGKAETYVPQKVVLHFAR
jgi:glycogen debranching enzyme